MIRGRFSERSRARSLNVCSEGACTAHPTQDYVLVTLVHSGGISVQIKK